MPTIEQLVDSIDHRLEELRQEIGSLEAGRAQLVDEGERSVLEGDSGSEPEARAPRRTRQRRPPRSKPATVDGLRRLLGASPDGLTTADLAERTDADAKRVFSLLRELESLGRARRTGQARGTRWHAVASEEEWIEQRAAELAARSRDAA
jgi:hypothetical protein